MVLAGEGETAVTKEENAELLDFHLSKSTQIFLKQHQDKNNCQTAVNATFKMWEIKRVLMRVKSTASKRNSYIMIEHMDKVILKNIGHF